MSDPVLQLHKELVTTIRKIHEYHVAEECDEDNFESTFETVYGAIDEALDPGGSGFGLGD